jgi:hypothetical protein
MQRKPKSTLVSGTRPQRLTLAAILGVFLLWADHATSNQQSAFIQAAVWTVGVFGAFIIELRKLLIRPRMRYLFMTLIPVHVGILYLSKGRLPFKSGLTIILLITVEFMVLMITYLRVGQELDPKGPLGLTDKERQLRSSPRRMRLFDK